MKHLVKYLELAQNGTVHQVADFVDTLTDQERIELRTALELAQNAGLARNLYYNYNSQKWIE